MIVKVLDCAVRLSELAASVALAASYIIRSIADDLHVAAHNAVVAKHDKRVALAQAAKDNLDRLRTRADDALSDVRFERRAAIKASADKHLYAEDLL